MPATENTEDTELGFKGSKAQGFKVQRIFGGFFVDNGSGGIENWRGGWPVWSRMTRRRLLCARCENESWNGELPDGPGLCGQEVFKKGRFGGDVKNGKCVVVRSLGSGREPVGTLFMQIV